MNNIEYYVDLVAALAEGMAEEAPAVVEIRGDLEDNGDSQDQRVLDADRNLLESAAVLRQVRDPNADLRGAVWWENLWLIIEGEYPLDQLPEHVRDLAAKLYYD